MSVVTGVSVKVAEPQNAQPGHPAGGTKDETVAVHVEGKALDAGTQSHAIHEQAAHVMERLETRVSTRAEMKHDEHAGHGADMVRDLFRRFIVSIIVSIPIVLFSPFAAELLPDVLRGTGFGTMAVVNGVGDLVSSLAVGWLWASIGAGAGFGFSFGLMLTGSVVVWTMRNSTGRTRGRESN